MFAVSEDGTVYVTCREPGDLLMLGGTDGDGRAEVRKIVLTMTQLHGIALHGSWNRKPPSGHEVVMVRFEDGRPVAFESSRTGFLTKNGPVRPSHRPGGGQRRRAAGQ